MHGSHYGAPTHWIGGEVGLLRPSRAIERWLNGGAVRRSASAAMHALLAINIYVEPAPRYWLKDVRQMRSRWVENASRLGISLETNQIVVLI